MPLIQNRQGSRRIYSGELLGGQLASEEDSTEQLKGQPKIEDEDLERQAVRRKHNSVE